MTKCSECGRAIGNANHPDLFRISVSQFNLCDWYAHGDVVEERPGLGLIEQHEYAVCGDCFQRLMNPSPKSFGKCSKCGAEDWRTYYEGTKAQAKCNKCGHWTAQD